MQFQINAAKIRAMPMPRSSIALLAGIAIAFAGCRALAPSRAPHAEWSRPHARTNLLVYRDDTGADRPVRNVRDWSRRRADILRGMQSVMGPFPGDEKRCALDLRVDEEVDCGSYVRRLITYQSEPGGRVPAYLLIPKTALNGSARVPAILCLHQTHAQGFKVVVGLGNSPNDQYGVELVERGYVCLAPSYPLLANYAPDLKALGYESGTMKAIWDNVRGLDLLESLPFVKRGAFGAIGHSLGGHNSVYTAVFDQRIKVIATSCGLDSYADYKNGDIRGWTSTRYMPKLLEYRDRLTEVPFDFHELIGALAPRACFINAPLGDDNFKWRSVDEIARAASAIYRLHGKPGRLRVEHPDCAHSFPKEMREAAYQLFDEHVRNAGRPEQKP